MKREAVNHLVKEFELSGREADTFRCGFLVAEALRNASAPAKHPDKYKPTVGDASVVQAWMIGPTEKA